jgi:hypothetical protein
MFALAAHADEREAHVREVEQYGADLPEGSYGRRNRQAIAARETRVTTRLRAVQHTCHTAIEGGAAFGPPESMRTPALLSIRPTGRSNLTKAPGQSIHDHRGRCSCPVSAPKSAVIDLRPSLAGRYSPPLARGPDWSIFLVRAIKMAQLHTPAEAADILRIREPWLRAKAAARAIPCTFIGKHLRFSDDDIAQIMAEGARQPVTRGRGTRR